MELELSLSPPNQSRHPIKKNHHGGYHQYPTTSTVPLLSWNHDEQPNTFLTNDQYHQRNLDDDEGILHSWRMSLMEENHHDQRNNTTNHVMLNSKDDQLFVKVKMDGVAIARKIDLNAFNSYQMLSTALIHMFDKSVEIKEDGTSYRLMYLHRDGHWHLGGDLPWEMFIRSVKRVQMVRN